LEQIKSLEGKPQLTPDGEPKTDKCITKSTATQYSANFRLFLKLAKCDKVDDIAACLRDTDRIVKLIEEIPNVNTKKARFNAIVAVAKYIPEIRDALGDAIEPLRKLMLKYIKVSKRQAVEDSGTKFVEALPSIRRRVEGEVKEKYGELSKEYIAGLLQTYLVGLRGELGTVRVFKSNRNGQFDNAKNAYNRNTGELKIEEFKTKQNFEGYSFMLKGPEGPSTGALYELLERWFKKHLRYKYLFGDRPVPTGPILKRALGISVMPIRHSFVTFELNKRRTSAHAVEEVANLFKHSQEMTLSYHRNEIPEDDVDGPEDL
jgi:hypothetical protein